MQQGISIQELARKIQELDNLKQDFIVSTDAIEMDASYNDVRLGVNGFGHLHLTDIAHRQIADKLQIPNTYYQRMLNEQPDLLQTNVNTWFSKNPEKRMLRTLKSDPNHSTPPILRAYLSDRFTTTKDNSVVANAVLPMLLKEGAQNGLSIKSCNLTEKRMYLQCVYPKLQAEVKLNDIIQGGIVISNSEIGLGSFQIELLLYRLVCMNGMIREASIRKHHVGRRIDTDEEVNQDFYRRETVLADQHAFQLKIADTVMQSFNKDVFDAEILRLKETANNVFQFRKAEPLVKVIAKTFMLAEDERGSILDVLADGKDWSQYGLANAVTAQSHLSDNYDRSIEFERMGGKIIDLSFSDWNAMLN